MDTVATYGNAGVRFKRYWGFHLIVFENTTPVDGKVWLDGVETTTSSFIDFLQFKAEWPIYDRRPW
jgi:hypothetical protein